MGIKIKGVPTIKIFPKTTRPDDNGFKIYGFLPDNSDGLVINKYGNISIKGTIPELTIGKEYEFEVEYEDNGKYDGYKVVKMTSSMKPSSGEEAFQFLCEIISPTYAQNLLAKYPDFIDRVLQDKPIDTKGINGVGPYRLNQIKQKVMDNFVYYDIITEFKDYELSMNQVKKLYTAYRSVQDIKNKMEENPYICLCGISGIGFKTADRKIIAHNKNFLKTPFRMEECAMYILSQNEVNGNTYMLFDDLYNQCKELTPECMDYLRRVLDNSNRIDFEDGKAARKVTKLCEWEIAKRLIQIKNNEIVWKKEEIIEEKENFWLKDYKQKIKHKGKPITEDDITERFKHNGNIVLTEQQNELLPAVLKNNVVILSGFAGTGKSATCKVLIDFLENFEFSYVLTAPTGRASKVLANYTGREAKTIHRALECKGENIFEYNENHKLPYDVVVVDEATMADVYVFRALLRAIDSHTKLILVCDPAQIPSVGAGNVVQDMIRSNVFPVIMLDQVFRYGDGGLSYVATNARNGHVWLTSQQIQKLGVDQDYLFMNVDKDEAVEYAISRYIKLYNAGVSINDMVIISCYNKGQYGTYEINNRIQNIINPPKKKNDGRVGYTRDGVNILFNVGDRVMMTKNNYKVQLYIEDEESFDEPQECTVFNGDFGIILDITDDGHLICQFDENKVIFSKNEASGLLLGYAVSCHKMQGDSRDNVILVTPSSHMYMLSRNLLYVALTRAKGRVYHYGDTDTIRKALKKSDNLLRKTFLENFLKKYEKSIDTSSN